jgi:hypothetical protein
MKTRFILFIAGICMFTCNSCLKELLCVDGDWIVQEETRRVTTFDQIENSTSFDVIYKQADTFGIRIIAEQNIMNYIETNVYDECLKIKVSPATICLDYNEQPIVMVSSPLLRKAVNSGSGSFFADKMTGESVTLKQSGSGDISVEMIESDDFESILSGSGDIDVQTLVCLSSDILISGSGNTSAAGNCETAHLKITGSGNIHCGDLLTRTASIIISGSGNIYSNIEEYLNALISGSGNIYVKGDPEIDQTISGSGRIIKIK